ncbi:MAG: DEAD/DEAH box helicase [Deltaproteobacteria bacterium]|nr:DEAD/DEAH box helicase [Deltaproteobacteria bacterium]
MDFKELGLRAELLDAVRKAGYTTPTPIQAKAIPVVLNNQDVLAGAQTGTGKTAAFTLPMLEILSRTQSGVKKSRRPRALVLTPTRELAAQVAESVALYGRNLRLNSTVIYGGVGINPQINSLKRGVDIIIATPGRLLDHASRPTVDLSTIEILVLDEADRMLDMGFIHDIKRVIKFLPLKRQNLLFSATYNDEIKKLASGLLNQPELIEVARRNTTAELVSQVVHPVGRTRKRELLSHIISDGNWKQVLVFTRTKHGANRLSKQLITDKISATAIHGDKTQGARTRALADFKRGQVRVLVATDIAARGLDIDKLPHVVNYDLPHVPEDYVHRIGRTGRAGLSGEAVSIVCPDESLQLRNIERLLGKKIEVKLIPGYTKENIPTGSPQPTSPRRTAKHGVKGRPKWSSNPAGRSGSGASSKRRDSVGEGETSSRNKYNSRSTPKGENADRKGSGEAVESSTRKRFFKGKRVTTNSNQRFSGSKS